MPYKKLCNNNPKVEVAFDLLKHVKPNQGINIFFYGVEGTGKTELAKAIAKELRRPLVLTNISIDGVHRESKEDSTIQERLGSIMFAATKYQNKRVILLVDEADVILNCCEKGALNFFLEQIKVPVIWISNDIRFIENSQKRDLLLLKKRDELSVSFSRSCLRIDHQDREIRSIEHSFGAFYSFFTEGSLIVKSGCIDDHYRSQRQKLHGFGDRIRRRPLDVGNHGDLLVGDRIYKARFAGVSSPEETDMHSLPGRGII